MPNKLENIELRSEEMQEILTKVPHWMIRFGNVLFFSLIIMLLVISWFIKYPDVISTQAVLTTQIPPQKEYAKITEKIDVLLVKDNESVNTDQPLAILKSTTNIDDLYKLKSIVDTIKINTKSFTFPIDSLPILFLGDIESQYALFENSYIQYRLNKELKPFTNEAIANKYSISELNQRLKSIKAQKKINKTELEFKQKDLSRYKILFDKGVISAQDYENKQLEFVQAERVYKDFESSISLMRENISGARKTSKGTEINSIKEDRVLLKNVIQSFNQLKRAIKDWELQYVLKSNIEGKVSFLNFWKTNQTVNQGDLVFTIIPKQNSSFIAKLKTPAKNSGKIKIGQTVNINLENFPETEFGVLKGKVKNISLIPDKEGFYLIGVELPKELITTYNKPIVFKHEMVGFANIVTEDLRLIERFLYQFKDILKRK